LLTGTVPRKLAQELDELKRKIDDGEMTLDEIRKQTAAAERKLKSFTTMIANLTTRQEELTRQRDELLREYNQADADKSRLDSELAKTEKELEKVREKLTNRQLQLSVTEQELDVLHQQVVKAETQVQEMDAELGRMSGDYTKQVELRLKSVAMDEMVSTVHDMLTTNPSPRCSRRWTRLWPRSSPCALAASYVVPSCCLLVSLTRRQLLQRVTAVVAVEVICPGADVKTRMNASG
jgi:chromosome segregation ATPase